MKVSKEFCDVCRIEFHSKQDKYGLLITIGHSPCGWGHRSNLLEWSGEVCGGCHKALGTDMSFVWKDRRADREALPDLGPPPTARLVRKRWCDRALERIKQHL